MSTLTPEALAADLAVRDLTDPAQGPHAVQAILAAVLAAVTAARPTAELVVHRGARIVDVADNYDRLGYSPEATTRDSRYTRYVDDRRMLRSQTSALIPGALRSLPPPSPGSAPASSALHSPGPAATRDARRSPGADPTPGAACSPALAPPSGAPHSPGPAATRDARRSPSADSALDPGSAPASEAPCSEGGLRASDVLIACPGIVYRRDSIDRLHTGTPHQLDLWHLTPEPAPLLDLVATAVAAALPGTPWRTRPATHAYTTDGLEIEAWSGDAWVEIGECGVAAPHVIGTERNGLALGLGLDRLVMLRKGIDDIRLLRSTDPRVQAQMTDLLPYRPVSTQPAARRDLSVALPADVTAEDLGDRVRELLGPDAHLVEEVSIVSSTPPSQLPAASRTRLDLRDDEVNVLLRVVLRDLHAALSKQRANELRDRLWSGLMGSRPPADPAVPLSPARPPSNVGSSSLSRPPTVSAPASPPGPEQRRPLQPTAPTDPYALSSPPHPEQRPPLQPTAPTDPYALSSPPHPEQRPPLQPTAPTDPYALSSPPHPEQRPPLQPTAPTDPYALSSPPRPTRGRARS
ncbi:hypothetical protein [Actinoplanes sp. URMC 104]|uniref:PheS-related mystery ligase SrmL n=1 Tax=Actinoplanes sp. URMC 104 TaxID=3423409 RepID=UPI003F1AABDE